MTRLLYLLLLQAIPFLCFSQSLLPASRTANWQDVSALDIPILTDSIQVNINDYGADPSGATDNSTAFQAAFNFLQSTGKTGIVYFGAGTYLFNSTITLRSGNIILKGSGAATTKLRFILGGKGNLIEMDGSLDSLTTTNIIGDGVMNQYKLRVINPNVFSVGDMVKLVETDNDLVSPNSLPWALGTVGQMLQIKSIVGDSIEFYSTMRLLYPASRNPYLMKADPVKNVGISCLSIVRGDNVTDGNQYGNIVWNTTSNCWLNGIQSDSTFFAHVSMNSSYHNVIKGSYFANSYDYGDNGRGYGIASQNSSSENLVINNVFKMLRHAMLVQLGANGNVFAYNYSLDTYWVEGILPSDASGDIVFHGNYPFSNLFEGNIVQNLELDSSHGKNGPYNTFFRNRAENIGIYMNPLAGDSSAFIGNEVTTTSTKANMYFGLVYGLYTVTGNGNFEYGNNIRGTNKPTNTASVAENSYYLSSKPTFFGSNTWPSIGYPNTLNTGTIPAKTRYDASSYTVCVQPNFTVLALANIALTGKALSNVDYLTWTSASTGFSTIYKIMVSTDGVNFDSVAHQVVSSTFVPTTYQFAYALDSIHQKATTLYYKIQAFQNGVLDVTSNIISIKNDGSSAPLVVNIYPNPVSSEATAMFYTVATQPFSTKIIDQTGKQVSTAQSMSANGWNKVKFSLAGLPAGIYYLVINSGGVQKSYPIVKQ